jgi:hypothetical protein
LLTMLQTYNAFLVLSNTPPGQLPYRFDPFDFNLP